MNAGNIKISYDVWPDGDIVTAVNVEGDIPLVTQLGLLELAKDTILKKAAGEDHEYYGE